MKSTYTIILLIFSFIVLSCNRDKGHVHSIPIEDFFKNPDRSNMFLSPNGTKIAYLNNYKNTPNLFVEDLENQEIVQLTFDTIRGIAKYLWLNDDRILYLHDEDGSENYHLYSATTDGESRKDLTPFENIKMRLFDVSNVKGDEIYIALNKRRPDVFDLYSLNTQTGALNILQENNNNISYWKEDLNGDIRLAIATDGVNEKILFKKSTKDPFTEVTSVSFDETLYPISFTSDGNAIYALSNINRDKTALVVFDLITGKERSVIYENADVDVSDANISMLSNEPMYSMFTTSKYQTKVLNPSIEIIDKICSKKFKDESYFIVNYSKDETRFLIKTYSDKSLGSFYLFEKENTSLRKICDLSPWLKEKELCDMNPISYTSRDGLNINGYLTLPKEKLDQYPLIVYPHGGPWVRNRWNFIPEVQFFANRGYAVLQVNYRGSDGYGKAFSQAGFKEIGRKMQDDITDGVYYLISQKIIDTARIGIYGFSFGGYFALNGLIRDSGLYNCAVSYCGLPNLFTYIKEVPPYYHQYLQMMYQMIGNPETDAEYFRQFSPVFHTEKITKPVLIAQGAKDTRISVDDVNLFVKNLQKQGVPVKYIFEKEEGHGFQNQERKYNLFKEVEMFFDENLQ